MDVFQLANLGTLRQLRVCDVYVQGWDFAALQEFLPDHVITFLSTKSLVFTAAPDTCIWEMENSGSFSIASAYDALRPRQLHRPELIIGSHRFPPKYLSLFGDCSTDYLHFRKFSMTLAFKDRLSACSVIRRRLSSISSFFALSLLSFGLSLRGNFT